MSNEQDTYIPSFLKQETTSDSLPEYVPSFLRDYLESQRAKYLEQKSDETPTFFEAAMSSFAEEATFGLYNDPSLDASELPSTARMGQMVGSTVGFFGVSIAASIATGGLGTLTLIGARANKLKVAATSYNAARKAKDVNAMAKAASEAGLGVRGSIVTKLNNNNLQKANVDKFMKLAETDVAAARRFALGREAGKDALLFGFTGQLTQEDDASFKQRAVAFGQDAVAGSLFSLAPAFKFTNNPLFKNFSPDKASRVAAQSTAYFSSGFIASQPNEEYDTLGNRAFTGLITLGMGSLLGGSTIKTSKSDMKRTLERIGVTDENLLETYSQIATGVVSKEAGKVLTKQYAGIELVNPNTKYAANVKRVFIDKDGTLKVDFDSLNPNKTIKKESVTQSFHEFHSNYKSKDTEILRQIKNNHLEGGKPFSFFKNQAQLNNFLNREKYGILTANEPIFQTTAKTPLYGESRNDMMIRELLRRGYKRKDIMKTEGTYNKIQDGNSFIVKGMKEKDAVEIATMFGQESVVTNKGLLNISRPKIKPRLLYERDPITDAIKKDRQGNKIPKMIQSKDADGNFVFDSKGKPIMEQAKQEFGYRSGAKQFQIDDISYAPRMKTITYGKNATSQSAFSETTSQSKKPLAFALNFNFDSKASIPSKFKISQATDAAETAGDLFVIKTHKGDRKQIYRTVKELEQNLNLANSRNTVNTHRLLKKSLFNKNSLKEMTDDEIQTYGALLKEDSNFMVKGAKEVPLVTPDQAPEIGLVQKITNFVLPSSSKFESLGKKFNVPGLIKIADDMKSYRRYNEELKSAWIVSKGNIDKKLAGYGNDIDQAKVLRNLQFKIEKGKFGSLIEDMSDTEISALDEIMVFHKEYMDDMYKFAKKYKVKQKKVFINKKGKVDVKSEPLEQRENFVSLTVTDEAQSFFSGLRGGEVREDFIERIINRNSDFVKKGKYANLPMNKKRELADKLLEESLEQSQKKGIFGAQYSRLVDLDAKLYFDGDGRLIRGIKDMKLKKGDSFEGVKIGKVVDIYDMDYTANMDRYAARIANITSASRYFGSDGLKIQGDVFSKHFTKRLESIRNSTSTKNYKYFKSEIEKDMEMVLYGDGYNDIVSPLARGMVSWTASLGLSSPMSALKNTVLGGVQTYTTFGGRAALTTLYKTVSDKKYREAMFAATEAAGVQTAGNRFLETQKIGAVAWSRQIQRGLTKGMSVTEHLNRTFSAMVGSTAADDALKALRGDTQGVMTKLRKSEARRILDEVLEVKDWQTAVKKGSFSDDQMKQILFQSHYITQGLADPTSVPRIMNKAYTKPFTLFYRIAFRVTDNVYKNAYKPIINDGNIAPMMRYVAASTAAGAGLQAIYHKAYNTDPEAFAKAPEIFWDNFVAGEGLGILATFANTTGRGFEGMTPAIIQQGVRLTGAVSKIAEGTFISNTDGQAELLQKQGAKELLGLASGVNFVVKTVVNNTNRKTYQNFSNFKQKVAQYRQDIIGKPYSGQVSPSEERTLFYRLNQANLYSDVPIDKKVKDFYSAVGYFQHQFEMENTYRTTPKLAKMKAYDKVFNYILNESKPVNLSRQISEGKTVSDYEDFKMRLNDKDLKELKELEKIYRQKTQEMLRAVISQKNKYLK